MNLSNYYSIFYILILLSIYSCEDVIDVQLQDADSEIVIDAWISDEPKEQVITLSLSQNYFNADFVDKIVDAEVKVIHENGQVYDFIHQQDGQYVYDAITNGSINRTGSDFILSVTWDGVNYSARTAQNRVPAVDSIGFELRENELIGPDGIYAQFFARDFVGHGDAYWIKTYKNGVFRNGPREMNIAYDAAFDAGTGVDGIIFIPPVRELVNPVSEDFETIPWLEEETMRVEIHSISTTAFQFLEIARDQMINGDNGIFAIPLANTRSNIKNTTTGQRALGFFNVASVSALEKAVSL